MKTAERHVSAGDVVDIRGEQRRIDQIIPTESGTFVVHSPASSHDWTRDQVLAIAADYEADGSLAERNVERWATEITRQLHAGGYLNTVEVESCTQ